MKHIGLENELQVIKLVLPPPDRYPSSAAGKIDRLASLQERIEVRKPSLALLFSQALHFPQYVDNTLKKGHDFPKDTHHNID